MHFITVFIAQYLLYVLLLATCIWWLKLPGSKKWRIALFIISSGLLALLLAKIGAHFINDPRPFTQGLVPLFSHADDNGFPSDHTLLAATLSFAVIVYNWRLGTTLLIGAIAIGTARVIANVHHTLDIVGALAIAAIATLIIWVIVKMWMKYHVVVQTNNTTR